VAPPITVFELALHYVEVPGTLGPAAARGRLTPLTVRVVVDETTGHATLTRRRGRGKFTAAAARAAAGARSRRAPAPGDTPEAGQTHRDNRRARRRRDVSSASGMSASSGNG